MFELKLKDGKKMILKEYSEYQTLCELYTENNEYMGYGVVNNDDIVDWIWCEQGE